MAIAAIAHQSELMRDKPRRKRECANDSLLDHCSPRNGRMRAHPARVPFQSPELEPKKCCGVLIR